MLLIGLLTNCPLRYMHSILYAIARTVPLNFDSTFRVRFFLDTCTRKGSRSRSRDGTPSLRLSTSRCALTCMLFLYFTCLKILGASRWCLVHLNWTRHHRDAPKIFKHVKNRINMHERAHLEVDSLDEGVPSLERLLEPFLVHIHEKMRTGNVEPKWNSTSNRIKNRVSVSH